LRRAWSWIQSTQAVGDARNSSNLISTYLLRFGDPKVENGIVCDITVNTHGVGIDMMCIMFVGPPRSAETVHASALEREQRFQRHAISQHCSKRNSKTIVYNLPSFVPATRRPCLGRGYNRDQPIQLVPCRRQLAKSRSTGECWR